MSLWKMHSETEKSTHLTVLQKIRNKFNGFYSTCLHNKYDAICLRIKSCFFLLQILPLFTREWYINEGLTMFFQADDKIWRYNGKTARYLVVRKLLSKHAFYVQIRSWSVCWSGPVWTETDTVFPFVPVSAYLAV